MTNPNLLAAKKGKRGQSCIDVNVTKQAEVANELCEELMTVLMKEIEMDDIESIKIGLQKMDDIENVVDEKVRTTVTKLQKLQVDRPGMIHKMMAMVKGGEAMTAKAGNFRNLPELEDRM